MQMMMAAGGCWDLSRRKDRFSCSRRSAAYPDTVLAKVLRVRTVRCIVMRGSGVRRNGGSGRSRGSLWSLCAPRSGSSMLCRARRSWGARSSYISKRELQEMSREYSEMLSWIVKRVCVCVRSDVERRLGFDAGGRGGAERAMEDVAVHHDAGVN